MAAVESLSSSYFDSWNGLVSSLQGKYDYDYLIGLTSDDGGIQISEEYYQILGREPTLSEHLLQWRVFSSTGVDSHRDSYITSDDISDRLIHDYSLLATKTFGISLGLEEDEVDYGYEILSLVEHLMIKGFTIPAHKELHISNLREQIMTNSYYSNMEKTWHEIQTANYEDLKQLSDTNQMLIHQCVGVAGKLLTETVNSKEEKGKYSKATVSSVVTFLDFVFSQNGLGELYSPGIIDEAVKQYLELIRPYNNQIRSHILNSR